MGEFRSTWVILLAAVFMVMGEVMSRSWRRSLFFEGVQLIKELQGRVSDPWMVTLQNLVSYFCRSATMLGVAGCVCLLTRRKMAFMVFLVFFAGNAYLNTLEKMLFTDPRPFWTSTSVRQLEWRPRDFGNPSGHSRSSAYFYLLVFSDLLARQAGQLVWLPISLLIAVLTPVSRLYLGAHSADQVLLGLLLGFGWLVIYKYGLQAAIYALFNRLIVRKSLRSLLLVCCANLLCLLLPLLGYQYKVQHLDVKVYGLAVGCPHQAKPMTGLSILTQNLGSCAIINVVFGVLVAVWASHPQAYKYYYGQWTYAGGKLLKLARIAAELLPAALVFLVFGYALPKTLANAYLKYLSKCVGLWSAGFLMCYATRPILLWLNIVRETQQQ